MTAVPATPALLSFSRRGWVQSPTWDGFWMFSAIWGGALLLLGSLAAPIMPWVIGLLVLQRGLSVLHSWSTTWMVMGSSLLADVRRSNRVKFAVVPAALVSVGLGRGLYTGVAQRYPEDGGFAWSLWAWGLYLILFWAGHFWHFGNQDFGVLTIYRAKAGQGRPVDRRVDKLYTVAMMFLIQPVVYVGLIDSTAFSELVRTVLPFIPSIGSEAATIAVAVAALLTLGCVGFELSKPNRSLPKLLYIFVIFLHPVLLWGATQTQNRTLAYAYVMAYLWSHWFIAIALVGRINTGFYRGRGDTPWLALVRHGAVLGAIVGVVLILTERHKDYLLFNTAEFRYKELLASITPEQGLIIGGILGFFLAEQLLHYWCDRCLFRFRDPRVRARVAPLLLGDSPEIGR